MATVALPDTSARYLRVNIECPADMLGNAVGSRPESKYGDTGAICLVAQQPCFKLFITLLYVGLNVAAT